eukprot:366269-Chlamydomonas_euryale.AAC.4
MGRLTLWLLRRASAPRGDSSTRHANSSTATAAARVIRAAMRGARQPPSPAPRSPRCAAAALRTPVHLAPAASSGGWAARRDDHDSHATPWPWRPRR